MTLAAVVALGLAVALLGVLVAGLLRSHAEILRALHELGVDAVGEPAPGAGGRGAGPGGRGAAAAAPGDGPPFAVRPDVAPPREEFPGAADVSGTTPDGDVAGVAVSGVGHDTVLVFLSSTCVTCSAFWEAFRRPGALRLPPGSRLVAVTKDADAESPARLRDLAPPDVPVVLSSQAWRDYEVPLSPYVVLVEGATGRVRGEGAATTWDAVADLLAGATADLRLARAGLPDHGDRQARAAGLARADLERERRADRDLARAGITPGHPSLHPRTEADLGGEQPSPGGVR